MPILHESEDDLSLPEGFVYLDEAISGVAWEAKYATRDNFTGAQVPGYEANRIAISTEMVTPLQKAASAAAASGYRLLVWDGARPQRAVDAFMAWSVAPEDGLTKDTHYPNLNRSDLFTKGYLAKRSGHSRGAAVDLTLTDAQSGELLDMGTGFDYMDVLSHHGANGLTEAQRTNRNALAAIMRQAGFERYESEWWHYMLSDDPHPGVYFDFVIADAGRE